MESLISHGNYFSTNEGIDQIVGILGGEEQQVHMNDYPNVLSKTKGSIPERLLSVSVQIWLHMMIIMLAAPYNETPYSSSEKL